MTNALDGPQNYLVSDKLFARIGDEMVGFRKDLMLQNSVKTLKEVIRDLMPPKEAKRKANVEGSELLDCEDEEISLEEFQQECDEDEKAENDLAAVDDNSDLVDTTTVLSNNDQSNSTSIPKHHLKEIQNFLIKCNKLWPMVMHQSYLSPICLILGWHIKKLDVV